MEYDSLLEMYCEKYFSIYTTTIPPELWGDENKARVFMEKYWLSYSEMNQTVTNNLLSVFDNIDKPFPMVSFKKEYKCVVNEGGRLLIESDLERLKEKTHKYGDNFFYIIQNNLGDKLQEPAFRMKFPAEITWTQLMAGNYISTALFEMPYNEYFIIGQSGNWGEYCTNEHFPPFHIIGAL